MQPNPLARPNPSSGPTPRDYRAPAAPASTEHSGLAGGQMNVASRVRHVAGGRYAARYQCWDTSMSETRTRTPPVESRAMAAKNTPASGVVTAALTAA
jgi:hypothetical protein